MAGSLDITDTDLCGLFNRYPEITFDSAEDVASASAISDLSFSSPGSDGSKLSTTPNSRNTRSTAHTTPLRLALQCDDAPDSPSVHRFLADIEKADLPSEAKRAFGNLAREITRLGSLLVPEIGHSYRVYQDYHKETILDRCHSLLADLQQANTKVADEIQNIEFIQTRAPFTVEPAVQDLWCSYRQRAKLITQ
jgi:hypothetical protein